MLGLCGGSVLLSVTTVFLVHGSHMMFDGWCVSCCVLTTRLLGRKEINAEKHQWIDVIVCM